MSNRYAICFTIIIFIISVLAIGCNNNVTDNTNSSVPEGLATPSDATVSKSGKFRLIIKESMYEGVKSNNFAICLNVSNSDNTPIFVSENYFRTRDRLYFLWDDEDRVWVYSGDVGTFYWVRIKDTEWTKHAYSDNKNIPVPELLKKLLPSYYE